MNDPWCQSSCRAAAPGNHEDEAQALSGLRGTLAPISATLDSVRRCRQPDSSPISKALRRDSALSGIESMAFGALPRAAKSWSKAVLRSVSFLSLPAVIPMSPEGAALLTQPRRGVETSAARSGATLGHRQDKRQVLKGRSSDPKANLQADLHLAAPPRSVLSGLMRVGRRTQDCAGSLFARPLRPGLPLGGTPFQGSGKSGLVKIFVPEDRQMVQGCPSPNGEPTLPQRLH